MHWLDWCGPSTQVNSRGHSTKHSGVHKTRRISWPDELLSVSFYRMSTSTNVLYRVPFIQRVSFVLSFCLEHRSCSKYPGECRPSVRWSCRAWCGDKKNSVAPKLKEHGARDMTVLGVHLPGFVKQTDERVNRRPAETLTSYMTKSSARYQCSCDTKHAERIRKTKSRIRE